MHYTVWIELSEHFQRDHQSSVQIATVGFKKMEGAIECIAVHVENIFVGNVVQQILLMIILENNVDYGLVKTK